MIGQKIFLVFNKNTIEKLKVNYSQIKEITIFDNTSSTTTNTFNTFNTFWKGVERNENHKTKINSDVITKREAELKVVEGISKNNDANNHFTSAILNEDQIASSNKVLGVLEVLEYNIIKTKYL